MNLSTVQKKAQVLKDSFDKTQSNKSQWENQTRDLVKNTLAGVVDITYLNWTLQEFDNKSLGLFIKNDADEDLANLLFSLTYDGLISIDATFYTLLYNPNRTADHFRGIVVMEPQRIDRDAIYVSLERFLDIVQEEYFTQPTQTPQDLARRFF